MEEEDIVKWDFAVAKPTGRRDPREDGRPGQRRRRGGRSRRPSAITATPGSSATWSAAIRAGRPPAIDGREGRRAVEIILAIYKSAETGRSVTLPLPRTRAQSSQAGRPHRQCGEEGLEFPARPECRVGFSPPRRPSNPALHP